MHHSLKDATGLDWLVGARNEIQSLMLRLYKRWDKLDDDARQFSLGVAFSLWRAVFLIDTEDIAERSMMKLDEHAERFLKRVVETNNIGFADDWNNRGWTSGYYVNNAAYRVSEMEGESRSVHLSTAPLRAVWCETLERLEPFVDGTRKPAATRHGV